MAENSNNKIFDEDGSNYHRIQDLLMNIVSTKEEAKVAIGVSKKKICFNKLITIPQKSKVGTSQSNSTIVAINHTITTIPNNDEVYPVLEVLVLLIS